MSSRVKAAIQGTLQGTKRSSFTWFKFTGNKAFLERIFGVVSYRRLKRPMKSTRFLMFCSRDFEIA